MNEADAAEAVWVAEEAEAEAEERDSTELPLALTPYMPPALLLSHWAKKGWETEREIGAVGEGKTEEAAAAGAGTATGEEERPTEGSE